MSKSYSIDSRVLEAINNAVKKLAEDIVIECGEKYNFSGSEALQKIDISSLFKDENRNIFNKCEEKGEICEHKKKRGRPRKEESLTKQTEKKLLEVKKRGRPKKEKKIIVSDDFENVEEDIFGDLIKD